MSDISRNIKQQRVAKGMSQSQLAEKLCVTRQTVSSWERGVSFPDIKMLDSLSKALGVEVDSLIYPHSHKRSTKTNQLPLTPRFIAWSLVIYSVLFIFGGMLFAVPLMKSIMGGGPSEEFVIIIYWGLILLVGYIALCTCLISEYITESLSNTTVDESAAQDKYL